MAAVFNDWHSEYGTTWGKTPLCASHGLHQSALFSRQALSSLIDGYPRQHYSIISMAADGEAVRYWREGEINGMAGDEVIDAVASGRFWLNLRCVDQVDARYRELLEQMFGEISQLTGSSDFPNRSLGILISSPKAQVYYHCDLPNQSLWQIAGRKTVWVYPPQAPFLRDEDLERISIFEMEVDIDYQPWFDEKAVRFELKPGEMLHWPLNAPHRIVNHDCLNVSVTTEYWADDARRRLRVNMGNGTLRHRFGVTPRSRKTRGPAYMAKRVLHALVQRTGWLEKVRTANKPIEFQLDKRADHPTAD